MVIPILFFDGGEVYLLALFQGEVDDLARFFIVSRKMAFQHPSTVDVRFHHFGRDVFLWHGLIVMVDDGLGPGRWCLVGPGLICGAVAGDARVGAVLSCGSHCCGEVVVVGGGGWWNWWR